MIIFIAFVLQLGHKLIISYYEIKQQNNVQNLKKKKRAYSILKKHTKCCANR